MAVGFSCAQPVDFSDDSNGDDCAGIVANESPHVIAVVLAFLIG
jgi:hypothetical protein